MYITDFLHSSEASTPDNGNKGEVPIPLSVDENDNVVYVMHERRRYVGGWSLVLERFVASDAWVAIQALWPNINFKANTAKVKGPKTPLVPNRKLLQKCACRCTKGPGQPDETSCRICSDLIANLRKYYHDRNQWYKAAGECKARVLTDGRVLAAVNPCDQCGGECHQGMPYRTWPSSQQLMYDLLLCDPEPHPHLNVPALDKDDLPGGDAVFKPTMMYKTSCVKSTCGRCGFNNRFPLVNNGVSVVEAGGRVCPIEWTEDPQRW
jgi:hypothetical protein